MRKYPRRMFYLWGKDYALQAQGIYYRPKYSQDLTECDWTIWRPEVSTVESDMLEKTVVQLQARSFAKRARKNELWAKTEYTWDANAFADVFRSIGDDPYFEM
jgi:hypothetical protein